MGLFITLTVIGVLAAGISVFIKKHPVGSFQACVNVVKQPQPAFEVTVKGALQNREDNVCYSIIITDETTSELTPIKSSVGTQDPAKTEIRIVTPEHTLSRNAVLKDWTKIVTIPADKIEPGHHGNRLFAFCVRVNSQPSVVRSTAHYHYDDKGFLDVKANLENIYKSIFYLIDGMRSTLPSDTINQDIIAEWLRKEGVDWTTDERADIVQQYQSILLSPVPLVSWDEACEFYSSAIRRFANQGLRNRIIQLFFQLLEHASDSLSEKQRLEMLYDLSHTIDTDMGQFCRMAERVFIATYHQMHENCRLGIHDGMSSDKIHQRLKEEYKTWNSRMTHPDKTFREQAENMLELIARKRCELPDRAA